MDDRSVPRCFGQPIQNPHIEQGSVRTHPRLRSIQDRACQIIDLGRECIDCFELDDLLAILRPDQYLRPDP
jgi:hypothetical protein